MTVRMSSCKNHFIVSPLCCMYFFNRTFHSRESMTFQWQSINVHDLSSIFRSPSTKAQYLYSLVSFNCSGQFRIDFLGNFSVVSYKHSLFQVVSYKKMSVIVLKDIWCSPLERYETIERFLIPMVGHFLDCPICVKCSYSGLKFSNYSRELSLVNVFLNIS